MNMPSHFESKQKFIEFVETCCETLRQLHDSNPFDSPERKAIAIASQALLFCLSDDCFLDYLREGDELSGEQRDHLRLLGLDE